jgi:2-iminobutanoate/2-iminopropanoate deaminase
LDILAIPKCCNNSINIIYAELQNVDLIRANIYGATFNNADLIGAIMPDGEVYTTSVNLDFG